MKIKQLKISLLLSAIVITFVSCKSDDDSSSSVTLRDRTEQQAEDIAKINDYLSSHYYNSGFFEVNSEYKYTDIVITQLEDGEEVPEGHTLLLNAVETHYTTYLEIDYEYYILTLNEGGGESPKFTDEVRVRYEGASINNDGEVFESVSSPEDLLLQGDGFNTFGSIEGWRLVMPMFKTSTGFSYNNGSVEFQDFGLGVMFLPSGLAYFAGAATGTSYDSLIFKFELLQFEQRDHDGDGIPSYAEDLDNDNDVSDNDTDDNGLPNYVDSDDDGDGVATFDELLQTIYVFNSTDPEPVLEENEYEYSRSIEDDEITVVTVTALDTDNNGILDYLDEGVSINYNEAEE